MKTVFEVIGNWSKPTPGDYGLEIEVEGEDLPNNLPSNYWRIDADSSLRGESYEYVTPIPFSLEKIGEALNILEERYREDDSIIKDSVRAGVHVHMNVQSFTINQLFTFIVAYYLFEEVLVHWCGPDREGNHFCLRHSDAEIIVFALEEALQSRKLKNLNTDNLRYSSLNVISLFKYGSLEFRAMRSTRNLNEIYTWVKIIDELKHTSLSFNNPAEMVMSMSAGGELGFLKLMFPTFYPLLESSPNLNKSIRRACRNIQTLVFNFDWNHNNSNNNPFEKKDF